MDESNVNGWLKYKLTYYILNANVNGLKSLAETMDTDRNLQQEEDMFGIIREGDELDPGRNHEQEEEHLDDFTGQFLNESGDGLEGHSDGIDVTDSSAHRQFTDSTVGMSAAEVYICPQVFVSVE